MSERSDNDLAEAVAGGCRDAFAMLIERHYDRIHRLAWRWSGSTGAAEDVAQEVCVKLASAIRSYRGEAAFTTWIYRITYTTTVDQMRAAQRIKPLAPSDMTTLIESAGYDDADRTLEGDELWRAVRSLPAQQRDAILLVYGEDMSHAEAARVMSCTEKTVSWHVFEAKKRLKRLLAVVD